MSILDQLQKDLVDAMKAKEEARLSAVRMIKAALMKAKVDSPKPLDDAAEQAILKILVKQRIDAADMFRKAGREEQAQKEEAEKLLIESYLPASASDEELNTAVEAAIAETGATTRETDGACDESGAGATHRARRSMENPSSEKVKAKLS